MSLPHIDVLHAFEIAGRPLRLEPHGNGHIHDTFIAHLDNDSRIILQRFNTQVFLDPAAVQENILSVTRHIRRKIAGDGQPGLHRRALSLVRSRNGGWMHEDAAGTVWRAFDYIPDTVTLEEVRSPEQAHALGRTFGSFQRLLADFDGKLHETIPNFHHTRNRYAAFTTALAQADAARLAEARDPISFARSREAIVDRLLSLQANGELPTRITHNDTKVNNLLFDRHSLEGLCVIDLDTVMPGLSLYDFGDMVRTGVVTAPENETDLERIDIDLTRFAALSEGYLEATAGMLTDLERSLLVFSGILLTFETGLRFLTDYLQGDTYFKIHYTDQNLDRCRNQFRLVERLEQHRQAMERLVG